MAIIVVSGMVGVVYAKTDASSTPSCPSGSASKPEFKIRDQNESWKDDVNATWTASNMAPGTQFPLQGSFVGLKSNALGGLGITCDYSVNEEVPEVRSDSDPHTNLHPDKMAREMIISRAVFQAGLFQIDLLSGLPTGLSTKDQRSYCDGQTLLWKITDSDRDGRISFYDLRNAPLKNLPILPSSTESARFLMSVKFADSAGNDLQGDAFNLNMLYTFNQW